MLGFSLARGPISEDYIQLRVLTSQYLPSGHLEFEEIEAMSP